MTDDCEDKHGEARRKRQRAVDSLLSGGERVAKGRQRDSKDDE